MAVTSEKEFALFRSTAPCGSLNLSILTNPLNSVERVRRGVTSAEGVTFIHTGCISLTIRDSWHGETNRIVFPEIQRGKGLRIIQPAKAQKMFVRIVQKRRRHES